MRLFIIGLILTISPLAHAETIKCPPTQANTLGPNQYAQKPGQPRCKHNDLCPPGQVTGTTYYMPNEKNPENYSEYNSFYSCADFGVSTKKVMSKGERVSACVISDHPDKDDPPGCCQQILSSGATNVEGTGLMKDGRMLESNGEINNPRCPAIWGEPTPLAGGSRKCLIPYITVACDTSKYPLGTIFEVPLLDQKKITMPNGKIMTHPKYIVCEDGGSWIQGEGRFDFFTGSYGWKSKSNVLGDQAPAPFRFKAAKTCDPRNTYRPIRHTNPDGTVNQEWKSAAAAINAAIQPGYSTPPPTSSWLTESTK